jgi:cation diffusion facilitator CzcD-associated flavoprotein CzcO/acetyl esterase/lipase
MTTESDRDFDVAIVGAGFAGMYLLHRLRNLGFSARVLEAADDVGGTWYWNRYPGARCDVESVDYSFDFDPGLEAEWTWSERYASQPEILRYAQHVSRKYDLRRDIDFSTRVNSAVWNDDSSRWTLHTSVGTSVTCRFYVMATGCLSVPKEVDIEGAERFAGPKYWTSRWPHEGVDFTGMRVGIIGTGSSAIQSIPIIAAQASQLTVFQRTPNFSIPAYNGPVRPDKRAAYDADPVAYRRAGRQSGAGVPLPIATVSARSVTVEERNAAYEEAWKRGGIMEFLSTYMDTVVNVEANDFLAEFVRNKIRATVHDPLTAETLCPKDYPIGTKRLCVDTNYYQTFNLPHVRLVDIRQHPIATITENGVDLVDESIEFDAIVFATGFDAMTGAIVNVDIEGRGGVTLKEGWANGPKTYLGLMAAGFPNLFMITGPGSPSVLSNMIVSIEQHVEWITECLVRMRAENSVVIEPTDTAVNGWVQHVNDFADITLMPRANSWYMGANVPGKARVFLPYPGGVDRYRIVCDEVQAKDYLGFIRRGPEGARVVDGVVRRLQPDVGIMLELIAGLGMPPLESMKPADVRNFVKGSAAMSPPGPDVRQIVDGAYPAAASELAYRLYRPVGDGPRPIIVYFHGGGWLFGGPDSDDPFCRDLCVRTGSIVFSVDYRHAPETRFPGAADDAEALGGQGEGLVVAGWSAGGNLAAVVCQRVRDEGGPTIAAQLLICPVTDSDLTRPSYVENGVGHALTASVMAWFWDNYTDASQRLDPRASPLRAATLAGLPPAVVVTCEFDPLRDEGDAYADALRSAGVPVQHIRARGHIHTSVLAVDMMLSGEPVRAEMVAALGATLGSASLASA